MKATVLYFSSSGNTAAMAESLAQHLREGGARVLLTSLEEARLSDVSDAEVVLIGSPAWTGESVVPAVEHFLFDVAGPLTGKRIGFFGTYDWGEGHYFDGLMDRLRSAGIEFHSSVLTVRGEKGKVDDELLAAFACEFCSPSPVPPGRG
jgi:flavorubredoxin